MLVLAFALLAAELPAPGDRVLPCRPTVACTAEISAPGQLELEGGFQHKSAGLIRTESVPLLFKLSLTDNFQLQLGTPGPTFVSGQPAFFDASQVLAKVALPLGGGGPTLGATAGLNLPTATSGRRTDALFALLASQDAFGFHADLNAGLNLLALGGAAERQPWAALSISRELPAHLTGMLEAWHSGEGGPLSPRDGGFLFALGWSPASFVCIDAGGDVALLGGDRRFSIFFGVTTALAKLWRPPNG